MGIKLKKIKKHSDMFGLFTLANQTHIFDLNKRSNILKGLHKRSFDSCTNSANLSKPFTNLYSIINIDLLITAYLNLKKNSETSIAKINEDLLLKKLHKLSERIKNKKFKWNRHGVILKLNLLKPPFIFLKIK